MIKYSLRENLLTAEPDDYMAQITDAQVYTMEDIIERMTRRGTTVTRTDIHAIMNLYREECEAIIEEGGQLNTPLVNTSASISGVFNGAGDSFDKNRHSLKLNISAGTALRDAIGKAKVQKVEGSSTDPYIAGVTDKITGSTAEIKAGSAMELTGSRLKFDAADEEQGVFAVPADGAEKRCTSVIENKPARVIVLLDPQIPAGEFTVEVRTRIKGSSAQLKSIKIGRYRKTLTASK